MNKMLKYILKQLRRSAVTNALFCLLLTLAGTLLCLSAGLWYSAHKALLDIDDTVTTIAVPDQIAIDRFVSGIYGESFTSELEAAEDIFERHEVSSKYQNIMKEASREILQTIRDEIYTSDTIQMDERRLFNAYVDGVTTIPMRMRGYGIEPFLASFTGQAIAAFVVTCERLETDGWPIYDSDWNDGVAIVNQNNYARFFVDDILHLQPAHFEPRYVRIQYFNNPDGTPQFEVGKQYVVIGSYSGGTGVGTLSLLEMPDVELKGTTVGVIQSNDELNEYLNMPRHWQYTFDEDMFPMDIVEYFFAREPGPEDGWYSFLEVDGSLEATMASDLWYPMEEALFNARISGDSFQVITTNNPISFRRFNQNRNLFDEGRSFSLREIRDGARVCLISRQFAELNELEVGDTLPMQLYNSEFGAIERSFVEAEGGNLVTGIYWLPTLYNSDLELSEPTDFEIIGIYNGLRLDRSEHAIPPNTVIIPNNSFGTLEGIPTGSLELSFSMPAPLLADGMIVPNGRIDETRAAIDEIVPGYGGFFRFFDQGYNSLILALGNLRFGMSWILALSAAGWIAVLIIFLLFYVSRKRKEAALLYAIGVSHKNRFNWVFTQCSILVLLALGISIAVSLPIYSDVLDIAGGAAQDFTDSFRDLRLSDAADSGLRSRIPLHRSPLALLVTVIGGAVITLVMAGVLSARSVIFQSMSEKRGDD